MKTDFPKKIDRKLKILAYYQLSGGILGLIMLLRSLIYTGTITGILLVILLFITCMYSLSIFSGRQILKGDVDSGLKLSILVQFVQIFSFAILGYSYRFISGIGISVGFDFIDGFNVGFKFNIPAFQINLGTDENSVALYINLMATYLIQYISDLREDIREYRLIISIDDNIDNRTIVV